MKTSISLLLVLCGLTTAVVRDHIYVRMLKNWTDAQSYCRQNYKDLSTIQSADEQQMLIMLQGTFAFDSWIGLYRDVNIHENFLWSDGDLFSFSNWESGKPSLIGKQQCVSTKIMWFDYECSRIFTFYCYTQFILIKEKMTWAEALEYCRIHHTDLASLTSETQLQLIKTETVNSETDSVWTGLRYLAGEWFWVNGKPLWNQVSLLACPVQPRRCGARNTRTDTWENRDCEEKLNFLCN